MRSRRARTLLRWSSRGERNFVMSFWNRRKRNKQILWLPEEFKNIKNTLKLKLFPWNLSLKTTVLYNVLRKNHATMEAHRNNADFQRWPDRMSYRKYKGGLNGLSIVLHGLSKQVYPRFHSHLSCYLVSFRIPYTLNSNDKHQIILRANFTHSLHSQGTYSSHSIIRI